MTRRLSARTQMYHHALIVALRTSPEPLTAGELVEHMPWLTKTRPHPSSLGRRCTGLPQHRLGHGRLMECDGITEQIEVRPASYQLYGYLTTLEKDGLVQRAERSVEGRVIYWELTARGTAAPDIAELRRIVGLASAIDRCEPRPELNRSAPPHSNCSVLQEIIAAATAAEEAAQQCLSAAHALRVTLEAHLENVRDPRPTHGG